MPFKLIFCLIGLFLGLITTQRCTSKRKIQESYINNDSTNIYSTHPSRPFKYGYAYSLDECKHYFEQRISEYGLKNGDVVADVGAASGWIDGAFSVFLDSVTFYVQDIDTHYLNKIQLDRVVEYYSKLRTNPQTNKFIQIIGKEKKTNLPDSTFDKIILNNTFHEIINPYKICKDLRRKLKPNGKIIIDDAFSSKYLEIAHNGCGIKGDKVSYVIDYFNSAELYLVGMSEPENSRNNILFFEGDYDKASEFKSKKLLIQPYIDDLDKFNLEEISKDSVITIKTALLLKNHLSEIHKVYNSIEWYLLEMGLHWFGLSKFQEAINVLKVEVSLYPNSYYAHYNLGEAQLKMKLLEDALKSYKKASELDPLDKDSKNNIIEVENILKSKK